MQRKGKGKFALLLLFLLPASCLTWFLEKPTFTPREVDIIKISSSEMHVLFGVDVQNPNSFDIKLKALEYTLSIQDQEIGKGRIEQEILIPKKSTTLVRFPFQVTFRSLAIPLGLAIAGKDLPCRIEGVAIIKARLGTATIPFSHAKEIKIKK